MIENVRYVANQRTLIKVETDKGHFNISYRDIRPYWNYATQMDFEYGKAIVSGDNLIFCILTAEGQGGVACVWDCNENKLIHISEASYFVSAAIANDRIYILHNIFCWGVASHLRVSAIPLGVMDAWKEGTYLYADTPAEIDDYTTVVPEAQIIVEDKKISIQFEEKTVLFTADETKATVMNPKFSSYYRKPDETKEEAKYRKENLIAGMLL